MTPHTVHLITREIRHKREAMAAEEKWLQSFLHSELRSEDFRRIRFWKYIFRMAELMISESDKWLGLSEGGNEPERFYLGLVKIAEHQLAIRKSGNWAAASLRAGPDDLRRNVASMSPNAKGV